MKARRLETTDVGGTGMKAFRDPSVILREAACWFKDFKGPGRQGDLGGAMRTKDLGGEEAESDPTCGAEVDGQMTGWAGRPWSLQETV